MSYVLTHTPHEPKNLTCPNPACGKRLTAEALEQHENGPQVARCPCCEHEITFHTELTLTVTVERNLYSTDTSFPRP